MGRYSPTIETFIDREGSATNPSLPLQGPLLELESNFESISEVFSKQVRRNTQENRNARPERTLQAAISAYDLDQSGIANEVTLDSEYQLINGSESEITNVQDIVDEGSSSSKSDLTERPTAPDSLGSHPLIFAGLPIDVHRIRDEDLECSNYRYHPVPDPEDDYDPIICYSGSDGLLPGCDQDESSLVRHILIHWSTPHKDVLWTNLQEGIKTLISLKIYPNEVVRYRRDSDEVVYGLNKERLYKIASVVLAIQQILSAFADFLNQNTRAHFRLDPGFKFLRSIAWNPLRTDILLTVAVIQRRIKVASVHVQNYFASFNRIFNHPDELNSVISHDSTRSSIWSAFATSSP